MIKELVLAVSAVLLVRAAPDATPAAIPTSTSASNKATNSAVTPTTTTATIPATSVVATNVPKPMVMSACNDIHVNVLLKTVDELGRGEAWCRVMEMMIVEAKNYQLNQTEIDDLKKDLAAMNDLLDDGAKELGVKRPFPIDDVDKDDFIVRATRRGGGRPRPKGRGHGGRSISQKQIKKMRRARERIRAEKQRSRQLKTCRQAGTCIKTKKPAPFSLGSKVKSRKDAKFTEGKGLTRGSKIGSSVMKNFGGQAWHYFKVAAGVVGQSLVSWGVFKLWDFGYDYFTGTSDESGLEEMAAMMADIHSKVIEGKDLVFDPNEELELEEGESKVERVIKGLRFDVNGFREMGKEIIEDIMMDFAAEREAEAKNHVSYGVLDAAVWADLKSGPLVNVTWDPVMNGAKAEYVDHLDAIRISIPANCTLM
jgi:hypothetical protein